jgi:hypothetical protein
MNEYKELIERYNASMANADDLNQLESLIDQELISLSQLNDITAIQVHLDHREVPSPSASMDANFYMMLGEQKRKLSSSPFLQLSNWWSTLWQIQMQWAYSLALVLIGGVSVYIWQNNSIGKIDQLTAEMGEMKELMMLKMLEQNSTTERLKAVSLTNDMVEVSDKVSSALFDALRHDENNNVRLAAINALAMYTDHSEVRKGLIESIQYQESPLVQLALAELMVTLNEKNSVKEFRSIIENKKTPQDVKEDLEKTLQVLI